jgi:carbamoyl-phosphate synthase large subunit
VPKRTDIEKILIVGSGPIIIGQACEFDYSGSQACKALKEEGYEVVLINSNPATIMTDPRMADRTYVEPITAEVVEKIIAKERPDAILPTLGGQTGLNVAVFLARAGVYERYGVEVLGASPEAISRAEDRELFKQAMQEIGLRVPESGITTSVEEGMEIGQRIGFPLILRPAFTLGGAGGSTAYNIEELEGCLDKAITTSPVGQVLVERSVLGWKEIEFEVMRDCGDNVIMIVSMENVDAMGVHTGDSIVVAPSQTLTAKEYVEYTDLSRRVIRKIDVTGGINIQYAGNPDNGDIVIIEVNPRLSRSSALASKATGFPIARVATKLAIGLTLDEILNDVTGKTVTFFEPAVDYCVFKIARFSFKKFPQADPTINTSMKSVGEAMSIGRNFKEALQKGIRSLEIGRYGLGFDGKDHLAEEPKDDAELAHKLLVPNDKRHFYVKYALGSSPGSRAPTASKAFRRTCCGKPSRTDSPTSRSASSPVPTSWRSTSCGSSAASGPPTSSWTPAPGSSTPPAPTTTRPMRRSTRTASPTARRSSSSAAARTASGRASSSTTAAATPATPSRSSATSRSSSTPIPRPSRPTTTPRTSSTSSRSPARTSSQSSRRNSPRASSSSSAGRRR